MPRCPSVYLALSVLVATQFGPGAARAQGQSTDVEGGLTEVETSAGDAGGSAGEGAARPGGSILDSLGLGAGIGFVDDITDISRVSEAILDENNIVRVSKQQNDGARLMLEAHALKWNAFPERCADCKWGPFFAITPGDDELITGMGFGWMLGIPLSTGTLSSFNVGFGAFSDSKVQTLGNGIREDEPLPAGETMIRLKEREKWAVVLLFTVSMGDQRQRTAGTEQRAPGIEQVSSAGEQPSDNARTGPGVAPEGDGGVELDPGR